MKNRKKEALHGYVYILPSFILLCAFSLLPLVMNIYFSFTKYNVVNAPEWIGFANYARLFKDPNVIASLKNTLIFTVVTVPIQTVLSLVLAAIIAAKFRGRFGGFVKSSMFVPVIASAVLVGTLFVNLFAAKGPINELLNMLGLNSVSWMGGKVTSMFTVCFATIWKNVGYFLVIFYAGVMDIPVSLYEAAEVDGATKIQQFLYITLPSLKNIIYLVVILGTIWSFQVFDMVYTMTGGGPGLSTQTLVLTIYKAAFKEYSMGYAAAVSMLLFAFVLLVSFLQQKLLGGGDDE